MDFNALKTQIKGLGAVEVRADNDSYLEVVITQDKMAGLTAQLEGCFGPPRLPKDKLADAINKAVEEFGGIMRGQTLYVFQNAEMAFAMIWPWQDGEHNTMKMAKVG